MPSSPKLCTSKPATFSTNSRFSPAKENAMRKRLAPITLDILVFRIVIKVNELSQGARDGVGMKGPIHFKRGNGTQLSIESSPCPPREPSDRGGRRVLWSGCRRVLRYAERLPRCRHFPENW